MYLPVLDVATLAALTDFASDSAGTAMVITGVAAGAMRAGAILLRFPAWRVERVTAVGFFAGAACMILLVLVDTTFSRS
jgi:hypothetical protein